MWHTLDQVAKNNFFNKEQFKKYAFENMEKYSVVDGKVSSWFCDALVKNYKEIQKPREFECEKCGSFISTRPSCNKCKEKNAVLESPYNINYVTKETEVEKWGCCTWFESVDDAVNAAQYILNCNSSEAKEFVDKTVKETNKYPTNIEIVFGEDFLVFVEEINRSSIVRRFEENK